MPLHESLAIRRPKGFWEDVAADLCTGAVPGALAKDCKGRYLVSTQYRHGGNATFDKAVVMSEGTQHAVAEAYKDNDGHALKIVQSDTVKARFRFTLDEMKNFLRTATKMVANVDAGRKPGKGRYEFFETSGPATGPRGTQGIRSHDGESNEIKGFVSTCDSAKMTALPLTFAWCRCFRPRCTRLCGRC